MRDVLPCSVTPMLMGNNKRSRRLARRLFWKLGLRSSIFYARRPGILEFTLAASYTPIGRVSSDEFILMGLERFISEREGMTFLLVPCSYEFEKFIKRNRTKLENSFIIRSLRDVEVSICSDSKMPYAMKGIL